MFTKDFCTGLIRKLFLINPNLNLNLFSTELIKKEASEKLLSMIYYAKQSCFKMLGIRLKISTYFRPLVKLDQTRARKIRAKSFVFSMELIQFARVLMAELILQAHHVSVSTEENYLN